MSPSCTVTPSTNTTGNVSSFRIVPTAWPDASRANTAFVKCNRNVSSASKLQSPTTITVIELDTIPGNNTTVPVCPR